MTARVLNMVNKRKIAALETNIQELSDVTTILKSTMTSLSKYNHYSKVRSRVNELFAFYNEVKADKEKQTQHLERLKNE